MGFFFRSGLCAYRAGKPGRIAALAPALLLFGCERHAVERSDAVSSHAWVEATASRQDLGAGDAALGIDGRVVTSPLEPAPPDAARVVRFPWRPPAAKREAYALEDAEDQHQIVLPAGSSQGGAYPVLVAFHGQPKRGDAPRSYAFAGKVIDTATRAMKRGDVRPVILALPVFRYYGTNWPDFDVEAFRAEIETRLTELSVRASGYYMVGHSGAAGCGGDGLNRAHRMRPAAVGFFDTCLGRGWRDEVQRLRAAHIPTLLVHSLETAGFSPRQSTEYLSTFDFGLAYGPAGLAPVSCPAELPNARLRDQPFRCSADERGTTRGLIVDSGEGEEGHNALVPIALEYFLKQYVGTQ